MNLKKSQVEYMKGLEARKGREEICHKIIISKTKKNLLFLKENIQFYKVHMLRVRQAQAINHVCPDPIQIL